MLQQQSRPGGFPICGSSMARHSSSSGSGGGLQETTGSDEDGAGGGSGGLLLHAFTLIGKSTRWTVAGMVGAVLLWRRCVFWVVLCVFVCDGVMAGRLIWTESHHASNYDHHRDAAVVTFTAGAILNALFGKVLKRIIKEVYYVVLRMAMLDHTCLSLIY